MSVRAGIAFAPHRAKVSRAPAESVPQRRPSQIPGWRAVGTAANCGSHPKRPELERLDCRVTDASSGRTPRLRETRTGRARQARDPAAVGTSGAPRPPARGRLRPAAGSSPRLRRPDSDPPTAATLTTRIRRRRGTTGRHDDRTDFPGAGLRPHRRGRRCQLAGTGSGPRLGRAVTIPTAPRAALSEPDPGPCLRHRGYVAGQ